MKAKDIVQLSKTDKRQTDVRRELGAWRRDPNSAPLRHIDMVPPLDEVPLRKHQPLKRGLLSRAAYEVGDCMLLAVCLPIIAFDIVRSAYRNLQGEQWWAGECANCGRVEVHERGTYTGFTFGTGRSGPCPHCGALVSVLHRRSLEKMACAEGLHK